MATTLVIEIVIGIIALVAGSFFWQLHKCDKFLTHAIHDASFLSQLISPAVLDSPPPMVAQYIERLQPGYYFFNIDAVIYSHKKTQLRLVPRGRVKSPYGPRYTSKARLDQAKNLDDVF